LSSSRKGGRLKKGGNICFIGKGATYTFTKKKRKGTR